MSKLFGCIFLLVCALPTFAASSYHGDVPHHYSTHTFGLFLGALDTPKETDTSVGIEYEYRHSQKLGFGLVYEDASGAHHDDGVSAAIASVYYHPTNNWRLGIGTGRERVGGSHPHDDDIHRVSIAYERHFGHWGLAPSFNIDRVNGHTSRVYGLTLLYAY